jgi:hypothetical protein
MMTIVITLVDNSTRTITLSPSDFRALKSIHNKFDIGIKEIEVIAEAN